MLKVRVIPCLSLSGDGLVKTVKFKDPKYVGDPINAVRIFNEKEVDELVFLDISATVRGREPNFDLLASIASEAFMPLGYGGAVRTIEQIRRLYSIGFEKVIINSGAWDNPGLVGEAAAIAGSQSVVVSMDVRRTLLGGYSVHTQSGSFNIKVDPVTYAQRAEKAGAGEILLTSIDRDGTQTGYDLTLIERVSSAVSIPVIACGGAGSIGDLAAAVNHGCSAVAAGSLFVFHGKHRAVLITYPDYAELEKLFSHTPIQSAAGS
jgi:imidazole glycerol-phosphate synthase subunit HisF